MTSKVIVALNYSEPGSVAPYQIQLDDGRLIFTPQDIDQVIRALDPVDEE